MRSRRFNESGISDDAYVELVRSLFATIVPTTTMGVLFVVVAAMAVVRHPDVWIIWLGVLGGAASVVRVAVTLLLKRRADCPRFDVMLARQAGRIFGLTHLAFATTFGLFVARALWVCDIEMQMVVAALVVGYASSVGAIVSLRPRISIPAVLVSVLPAAFAVVASGDAAHAMLALVLVALLAGGIGGMMRRYESEAEKIATRHLFASLARTDHLTGLANRLALSEAFEREIAIHGPGRLAVHCLDLDQFKPVNDQFGHPVGDALLIQVSDRLRSLCRGQDIAARLGGDEFVVLQSRIGHSDEADLMARRLVRDISGPYEIDGHLITIGVSLGYAVPDSCGVDLARLLRCADNALYRTKRDGGGAAALARTGEDGRVVTV